MDKYTVDSIIYFIKSIYNRINPLTLHPPTFLGNEKKYLLDCIDSTYVSYVGKYVTQFEEMTAKYTGSKYAVAVVNGTAALQIALQTAGLEHDDEVITQPLTFVATANAISHCGAKPIFVDVDKDTMGMSPEKLEEWLKNNTKYDKTKKKTKNKATKKAISAIVPVHTFGFPCRIKEIIKISERFNIPVVEDAAESLGSFYEGKHTGSIGTAGILSYNGNKTITTGGGGMIITDNEEIAKKARHITTTAKVPHKWEYIHDEIAYNYRLTNISAAIGVAQMENIELVLENKRETAKLYNDFFKDKEIEFITENENTRANYWLNCIKLKNRKERDRLLAETNENDIMTRPIWRLMNKLQMYKDCQSGNLENSEYLESTIINLPSGYRLKSER